MKFFFLSSVFDFPQKEETIATYSFSGVVNDSITYGNGKVISQTFDDLPRLASLDNGVKNYTYSYDAVNNITSDSFKDYSYDDIYRITAVNPTGTGTALETFSYDDAGNRTTDIQNSYTSNTLNQYTTLSGAINTTYVYDNNGNITDNGTYTFSYDYKNRVTQVQDAQSNIVVEYTYDVLGRRLQKQTADTTMQYIYSNKNVLEENRDTGTRTFKKIYINGLGVDNLLAYDNEEINLTYDEKQELAFCDIRISPYTTDFMKYTWNSIVSRCSDLTSSGVTTVMNRYYFHKNHLGSITGLTNETGDTVIEYDYDVFGNTYVKTGSGNIDIQNYEGELFDNTRLYTGREYDSETSLYFLRARYYDSVTGRFISRDPIGQIDDVNLYSYVGNNSVMYVDLFGKEKTLIIGFSGYPGPTEHYKGDGSNTAIYKLLQQLEGGKNVQTKFIESTPFGGDVRLALKAIKNGDYDKLIIVGHSFGADSGIELSNILGGSNKSTDLLITLDVCGGIACLFSEREVSKTVKKTVNYYQMNDFNSNDTPVYVNPFTRKTLVKNHIEKRLYGENLNQKIDNIQIDGSYHTSIDEDMSSTIYNLIKNEIGIN